MGVCPKGYRVSPRYYAHTYNNKVRFVRKIIYENKAVESSVYTRRTNDVRF